MNIYRFTFPIEHYGESGAKEKHIHIYFEAESCPTHEQVMDTLKKEIAEELKNLSSYGDFSLVYKPAKITYLEFIESLEEKLPYLYDVLPHTYKIYDTKHGKKLVSVSKTSILKR